MAAQWPAGDFLDAFKTQLEARPNLSGVTVYTGPPSPDVDTTEAVVLADGDVDGQTPWAALGQLRRDDLITVPCSVTVARPGAGETAVKTARDRVEALFVEVLAALADPPTVGTQTIKSDDITYRMSQFAANDSSGTPMRVCRLEFDFTVTVRVTST
jgi:hypothetical protein